MAYFGFSNNSILTLSSILCGLILLQSQSAVNGYGVWQDWSQWTACSETCGKNGTRTRNSQCSDSVHGCRNNEYESDAFLKKFSRDPCSITTVIDGAWTDWVVVKHCSKTCGEDKKVLSRTCTNPAPNVLCDGQQCSGNTTKYEDCNHTPCPTQPTQTTQATKATQAIQPIQGQWGEWNVASSCSVTCSTTGSIRSIRECNNPKPVGGGEFCDGTNEKIEKCSVDVKCPPISTSKILMMVLIPLFSITFVLGAIGTGVYVVYNKKYKHKQPNQQSSTETDNNKK